MPRLSKPRIEPLPQEKWSAEAKEAFTPTLPMGGGRPLNIFATLANHPALAKRWLVFGNHILGKNTVPPRERELVILRIGWNCQSEYEWAQHVVIGKRMGLTDVEIERITEGPDAPGWSDLDRTLLRATDELWDDALITDPTWAALAKHFNTQQLLDIVFTVGQYTLVSMALNTCGVQLDPGLSGFPATQGAKRS